MKTASCRPLMCGKPILRGVPAAVFLGVISLLLNVPVAMAGAEPIIGGEKPSMRPAGAPKIKQHIKNDTYFDTALQGVSRPYPPHLMFLKDQGAWYTPFTHPGMLPPYDIRGWHERARDGGKDQGAGNVAASESE